MTLRWMLCAFILLALGGCQNSKMDSGSVVPFRGGGMMALTLRPSGLGSGINKTGRTTRPTVASGVLAASLLPTAFGRCSERRSDARRLPTSWRSRGTSSLRGMCREHTP